MKVYRDLKIIGTQDALQKMIQEIEKNLDHGWDRDKEKEAQLNSLKIGESYMYCFICSDTRHRRASGLCLVNDSSENCLYVSNIVPKNVGQLSYDEYNYILEDFYKQFIIPAKNTDVQVVLGKSEHGIEDYMTPATSKLLRIFSDTANKSTGAAHASDEKRWFDFIIAIHKDKSDMDGGTLIRILIEEGWSQEIANELAGSYENARSLLKYYERKY
ncbi:hypothetical protein NIES4106_62210 (plasmid) [Fischerella sp. NIES-4106]|nr:hypothetical protein NIES4106_62210 [Fischerella sp. NIES-4106]